VSESVREQARAMAAAILSSLDVSGAGPLSVRRLAVELEPLLAAKAECEAEHPPEPEYLAWTHEKKWEQVADALAEVLDVALMQIPDRSNATRARGQAALALHSEAKKR